MYSVIKNMKKGHVDTLSAFTTVLSGEALVLFGHTLPASANTNAGQFHIGLFV